MSDNEEGGDRSAAAGGNRKMIDPFSIGAIVGRHSELIRTITAIVPEIEQVVRESQDWLKKHQAMVNSLATLMPEIVQSVHEIEALGAKHQKLITTIEKITPEAQQLTKEVLPYLQQG